jgi:hypothetical protein
MTRRGPYYPRGAQGLGDLVTDTRADGEPGQEFEALARGIATSDMVYQIDDRDVRIPERILIPRPLIASADKNDFGTGRIPLLDDKIPDAPPGIVPLRRRLCREPGAQ